MTWIGVAAAVVVLGAAFFAWANRRTREQHARSTPSDVESALLNFVSPEPGYFDEWELFLAWPIDDPYLESIRQQCLQTIGSDYSNHSPEAVNRVSKILADLRSRAP